MKLNWIKRNRLIMLSALLLSILIFQYSVSAAPKNGFDVSNAIIPVDEILSGGPPKDGIPALTDPEMVDAEAASYLKPDDRILGVTMDGVSRAYPISILNWHEIVNDAINGQRFAVTFCPLCGTGAAFYAEVGGKPTEFGVSGLLYNSNVLLYDRETESLWSQVTAQAISGKQVGKKLTAFPISHTTWSDWVKRHPDTQVLSTNTGYYRDYDRDPYQGYYQSRQIYFSVNNRAPDLYHPKEVVVGVEINGVYKAYPFVELEKNNQSQFEDTVNGASITVNWDSENRSVSLLDSKGKRIVGDQGFWFAWFAFHPDTLVYKAGQGLKLAN